MPFTVPRNPAPYPTTIGRGFYTWAPPPSGGMDYPAVPAYLGVDWTRLAGPTGQMEVQHPEHKYLYDVVNPWAQTPGYTEPSVKSRYQDWWRGAAFGPRGRGYNMGDTGGGPPPPPVDPYEGWDETGGPSGPQPIGPLPPQPIPTDPTLPPAIPAVTLPPVMPYKPGTYVPGPEVRLPVPKRPTWPPKTLV